MSIGWTLGIIATAVTILNLIPNAETREYLRMIDKLEESIKNPVEGDEDWFV